MSYPTSSTRTSQITKLLQYALIAIFGYLLGCVSPSKFVKQIAMSNMSSRNLEEEVSPEGEEEGEGFNISSDEDVTIVTCIVLLLIFLTIVFEYSKEYVEERASSNLLPLVEKLFGEMTVLGFLSIVTFVITKAGWFAILSEKFFGEAEELLEIFEFVHFTIFFIMITFVAQVLILVAEAMQTEKEWTEMDKAARDPSLLEEWERRAESYYESNKQRRRQSFASARETTSFLPFLRSRADQRREDQVLFKALRDEFLLERSPQYPFHPAPEEKRVSDDFNFGRYLGINQGGLLAHVVEVSIVTWSIYAMLTVVYYLYVLMVNENVGILAWSWVGMGWIVYAFNVYFEKHLVQVRRKFLKKEVFLMAKIDQNNGGDVSLLDADETTYLNSLVSDEAQVSLPMWTEVDIDSYNEKRPWLVRWLVGGHPTRQQSIYWMDRRGPKLYLLVLQSNLLFLGIYAAMNVLGFFSYMYKEESTVIFVAYIILSTLPVIGIMFFKKRLVAILSQVCCMGAYRRPNVVADVLREEKTGRVVRAFIVIYKMRRFAREAETSTYDRHTAAMKRKKFDKIELAEVGKTFDTFDTSGDGSISYDEFENLMNNLGAEVSKEGLKAMIGMLDEDGDGEVSKEEFVNWYAENAHDDRSEMERAHDLFMLFDKDDSGELTIAEFKLKLDALNVGFSVDEVGAIVNELDEDNSGTIGLHEFALLLRKYYPKELLDEARLQKASSALFNEPSHHHGNPGDWNNSVMFH